MARFLKKIFRPNSKLEKYFKDKSKSRSPTINCKVVNSQYSQSSPWENDEKIM